MTRRARLPVPPERQIHLGVCRLLKLNAAPRVVWFHVPNERRTSPREGAFLKLMGVLPGVADFLVVVPRDAMPPSVAFLELKRPGGRLSPAQEQFRDDVTAIGCLWGLAYSTDTAAALLRQWGALRSPATQSPAESERSMHHD